MVLFICPYCGGPSLDIERESKSKDESKLYHSGYCCDCGKNFIATYELMKVEKDED